MRIILSILFLGLSTSLGAQSYFNMRYSVDGKWGGGARSIVSESSALYVNMFSIIDTVGYIEQTINRINTNSGVNYPMLTFSRDSTNFYSVRLIPYSLGGLFDVFTVEDYTSINNYGYLVIKYNVSGDTIFTKKRIDSSLYLSLRDVAETHDKGLVFAGITRTIPADQNGTHDIVLIKTDSLGNELWRKTYGNTTNFEQGYSVAATPDGGYIIGGLRSVPGTFSPWLEDRPYVIKTDSVGNVEWDRVYGAIDTTNLPVYDIITTQDGGYAFVGGLGMEKFTGNDDMLPWIVKLNSIGDTLWTRTIYGYAPNSVYSKYKGLIELDDGSLVACGQELIQNPDTVNYDGAYRVSGVISKYSPYGYLIWSRNYLHPENLLKQLSQHIFNSIVQTPDGGFAAAGSLLPNPPDTGTQDTWVVKVDSFGCLEPGCEVVSVPKIEGSIASLKTYPNPASEVLNVEITPRSLSAAEMIFELYDILGKRVLSKEMKTGQNTLNIQHLPSGVYTYKIGEVLGKIVKQF